MEESVLEKKEVPSLLKVFGVEKDYRFYFANAQAATTMIDDSMFWGLCTLLQTIAPKDVQICMPLMYTHLNTDKTNTRQVESHRTQTKDRLKQLRTLLEGQLPNEIKTIFIPFNTGNSHWHLMMLRLNPDKKGYTAQIMNSINLLCRYQPEENIPMEDGKTLHVDATYRQYTAEEVLQGVYSDFVGQVQSVLGRISKVEYKQEFLQATGISCGQVVFMTMLWLLDIVDPMKLYPGKFKAEAGGRNGEFGGYRMPKDVDNDIRLQILGLLYMKFHALQGLMKTRLEKQFKFTEEEAHSLSEGHQLAMMSSFIDVDSRTGKLVGYYEAKENLTSGSSMPLSVPVDDNVNKDSQEGDSLSRVQLPLSVPIFSEKDESELVSGDQNQGTDALRDALLEAINLQIILRNSDPEFKGKFPNLVNFFSKGAAELFSYSKHQKVEALKVFYAVVRGEKTEAELEKYRHVLDQGTSKTLLEQYDKLNSDNDVDNAL